MNAHSRRTGVLVALVAALVVAACGNASPTPAPATTAPATTGPTASSTPAPSGTPSASAAASVCDDSTVGAPEATSDANDPNAGSYTEIEGQVEDLRELQATTPVARGVFDTPGLCTYLRQGFRKDNPEALVTGKETLYKELGLMPADASLEQLFLELLTSQVAGLYDDETKRMYVVSRTGAIGPVEEITYAHEYAHALQDQAFTLREVVGEDTDQSDRTTARLSVVEGDATLLMSLWAQRFLTPAQLAEIGSTSDPASEAILAKMPAILKDPLLFPYTGGLQLTLGAFTNGGFAAVNELFANPPDSTEQVLHADKFAAREKPLAVSFPDDLAERLGDGWTVSLQDTFGEMLLEIVLRDGGATATNDAAAGWGGDRVALLEGPDGKKAVVLDTTWDSAQDATEFEAALGPTVEKLKGLGRSPAILRPSENRVVLVTAESADTMGRVANVLGLAE
ncbi:MAG TPA: hypothetical protein VES19_08315 [Candidatus Limnocylindrales bacterium]|nr:hypothetical protein [Candidatus Limnocylindrales bacterium]